MATRTLCQDICYGYNVFYENCICEDCIEKEETRNSIFFENQLRVDPEASSEFKSMDVVENLRPKLWMKYQKCKLAFLKILNFILNPRRKKLANSPKNMFVLHVTILLPHTKF